MMPNGRESNSEQQQCQQGAPSRLCSGGGGGQGELLLCEQSWHSLPPAFLSPQACWQPNLGVNLTPQSVLKIPRRQSLGHMVRHTYKLIPLGKDRSCSLTGIILMTGLGGGWCEPCGAGQAMESRGAERRGSSGRGLHTCDSVPWMNVCKGHLFTLCLRIWSHRPKVQCWEWEEKNRS